MSTLPSTTGPADLNQGLPWLTFALAAEVFALPISHVKEIIQYGGVTPIPLTPSYIRGVINLRGHVVPVLDLAVRFGKPAVEEGRRTCIIIVEMHDDMHSMDIGLVVDMVSEVLEIPAAAIEPAPAFGARIRTDFITGMAHLDGHFIIMLDISRILSLAELAELGQFEQAAG